MNWELDLELKALREEFIDSLSARGIKLSEHLGRIERLQFQDLLQEVDGIVGIAHKLAGVAESYGFATLTEIGAELDEAFARCPELIANARKISLYTGLLCEGILLAAQERRDPTELALDPRLIELRSMK